MAETDTKEPVFQTAVLVHFSAWLKNNSIQLRYSVQLKYSCPTSLYTGNNTAFVLYKAHDNERFKVITSLLTDGPRLKVITSLMTIPDLK